MYYSANTIILTRNIFIIKSKKLTKIFNYLKTQTQITQPIIFHINSPLIDAKKNQEQLFYNKYNYLLCEIRTHKVEICVFYFKAEF